LVWKKTIWQPCLWVVGSFCSRKFRTLHLMSLGATHIVHFGREKKSPQISFLFRNSRSKFFFGARLLFCSNTESSEAKWFRRPLTSSTESWSTKHVRRFSSTKLVDRKFVDQTRRPRVRRPNT
jgi:hypothetical protein